MNETPQEKALRLGVAYIPPSKPSAKPEKKPVEFTKADFAKFILEVEAVCGGCGKGIRRCDKRDPCGNNNCPFGTLTN